LKRAKILFISDLNKYNLFKEKNEIEIKKLKSFKIFLYFLKKYKSLLRLLLIIRIFKIKRVNYLKVLKEKMSILKASDINLFLFLIVRYMTVKVKLDRVY